MLTLRLSPLSIVTILIFVLQHAEALDLASRAMVSITSLVNARVAWITSLAMLMEKETTGALSDALMVCEKLEVPVQAPASGNQMFKYIKMSTLLMSELSSVSGIIGDIHDTTTVATLLGDVPAPQMAACSLDSPCLFA